MPLAAARHVGALGCERPPAPRRDAARARAAGRPRAAGRAPAGAAPAPRAALVADEIEEVRCSRLTQLLLQRLREPAQAAARACLHGTERDRQEVGDLALRQAAPVGELEHGPLASPAGPPSPGGRGRRPRTARRCSGGPASSDGVSGSSAGGSVRRARRGRRSRSGRPRRATARPGRGQACSSAPRARSTRTPPAARPRRGRGRRAVGARGRARRAHSAGRGRRTRRGRRPRRARAAPRRSARSRTLAASSRPPAEKGKRTATAIGVDPSSFYAFSWLARIDERLCLPRVRVERKGTDEHLTSRSSRGS